MMAHGTPWYWMQLKLREHAALARWRDSLHDHGDEETAPEALAWRGFEEANDDRLAWEGRYLDDKEGTR